MEISLLPPLRFSSAAITTHRALVRKLAHRPVFNRSRQLVPENRTPSTFAISSEPIKMSKKPRLVSFVALQMEEDMQGSGEEIESGFL